MMRRGKKEYIETKNNTLTAFRRCESVTPPDLHCCCHRCIKDQDEAWFLTCLFLVRPFKMRKKKKMNQAERRFEMESSAHTVPSCTLGYR